MTVDPATGTDATANLMVTPFIHSGYWLDQQMYTAMEDMAYEGTLEETIITSMKIDLQCFTVSTPPAETYLYWINYFALAVIPMIDVPEEGDPNDWSPITIPNLFVRDWGRLSAWDPALTDHSISGPALSTHRVLYRRFYAFPFGQENEIRGEISKCEFHVRLPRFRIPRNSALCLCAGVRNSHATATGVLTHVLGATFGYIHRQRG